MLYHESYPSDVVSAHCLNHADFLSLSVRQSLAAQRMEAIDVPVYDFNRHQRSKETRRVEPADVVLLEGILVLSMKSTRRFLNMKIFVDTDDDVRLARRCAPHGGSAIEHICASFVSKKATVFPAIADA